MIYGKALSSVCLTKQSLLSPGILMYLVCNNTQTGHNKCMQESFFWSVSDPEIASLDCLISDVRWPTSLPFFMLI